MPDEVRYLSTCAFDDAFLDRLREVSPRLRVEQHTAPGGPDVPEALWAVVEILHTSSALPEPGQAPNLRWVQLDTSGVDHLVAHPLWGTDVVFTSIGGVSPIATAEYVVLMILAFAHHLPRWVQVQAEARWPSPNERWDRFMPRRLPDATVTIVGYGRIGREVGRLARAFGMRVLGVRRGSVHPGELYDSGRSGKDESAEEVVGPDRLLDVIEQADYLVVTVPRTPETLGLVGQRELALVRPGCVVVNVSRGGVVDEGALLDALRGGEVAGAALDVFDEEPLPWDHPFWREPGVLLTPHVAGFAPDYEEQVLRIVLENLRRFLAGEPLMNRIDPVLGY